MDLSNNDKRKLYSLFSNMQADKKELNTTQDSNILIVDGLNCFFRAFMADPTMNSNGMHVGGISGFLKSVGYAIKINNPTRCVIVFDGEGGSLKRRKIYPDYKNKKKTNIRLNRAYSDDLELNSNAVEKQLLRLIQYLDNLPVTCMAIDHVEADDTIAYLALQYFKDKQVTIMSADKDFLQLVNDRIKVWSPSKKKLYGQAEILSEYGVDSSNFIFYRTLDGDMGNDNIPGIRGAGLKTILKCFPMLSENKKMTLQEIYNVCENNKGKYKLCNTILEERNVVERNYELMQLNDSIIQSFSQLRINEIMEKPVNKLNKIGFITLLREDGTQSVIPNCGVWLSEVWNKLDHLIK